MALVYDMSHHTTHVITNYSVPRAKEVNTTVMSDTSFSMVYKEKKDTHQQQAYCNLREFKTTLMQTKTQVLYFECENVTSLYVTQ